MFLLKPVLHQLNPELTHELTLGFCAAAAKIPGFAKLIESCYSYDNPALQATVGNLSFPNPVGLAAGFDKDGRAVPVLAALGFGFVEIGSVTPLPQPGNPKPRLFRLKTDRAVINRMGFNNRGVKNLLSSPAAAKYKIPIGVNLGKNKKTPLSRAVNDYTLGIAEAWPLADYFSVNISSPNTKNLRDLQQENFLYPFIKKIIEFRDDLAEQKGEFKQIWLKIAPDLDDEEFKVIADICLKLKVDALIVSNTTIARKSLKDRQKKEEGGLSGEPLLKPSNRALKKMRGFTDDQIPLIGVGGVFSAEDAWEKLRLGAKLVQIYTALVYEGPGVVKNIKKGLSEKLSANR